MPVVVVVVVVAVVVVVVVVVVINLASFIFLDFEVKYSSDCKIWARWGDGLRRHY